MSGGQIISFAWTTPALLARQKTVTRREWTDDYARNFRAHDVVRAYDRSPRHGGVCVALLRLRHVTYECDRDAPDSDYEAEGFAWLAEHPDDIPKSTRARARVATSRAAYDLWREVGGYSWVVRFDVLTIVRPQVIRNQAERPQLRLV